MSVRDAADPMAPASTPAQRASRARGSFFVRVGAVKRTRAGSRCEHTMPLFPLWLILDADGTLAARELLEQ